MKLYNSISTVGLTVLSVLFSSVAYSNNSTQIHSSSFGSGGGGGLYIYKIRITLNFDSYRDLYTKTHYIKIEDVNQCNNTVNGEKTGNGYKGTTVFSEPVPIGSRNTLTLVIPNLIVTQQAHENAQYCEDGLLKKGPSIRLSGDIYSTYTNSRICYFNSTKAITPADVGKSLVGAYDNLTDGALALSNYVEGRNPACEATLDAFDILEVSAR